MRSFRTSMFGLMLVGVVWGVGIAWPLSEGYYSILPLVRDAVDRSYTRLFDREDLRQDLMANGFRLGDDTFVRVFKQERRLEVWMQPGTGDSFRLFRTYEICSYSGELGPKLAEGDRQSPEGFYRVSRAQLNPNSRHHLSFNIGFPNAYDRAHDRTGSYLMVHGGCSSIGCYAVTDEKVDEIYAIIEAALDAGQDEVPMHIFPFEFDGNALADRRDTQWLAFWQNLKSGHDAFLRTGLPPTVAVCGQNYAFNDEIDGAECRAITGWAT